MNSSSETKIRRIERASVVLRAVCTAFIVVFAIAGTAAAVACVVGRAAHVSYDGQSFSLPDMSLAVRLTVAALNVATFGVLVKAAYHVRRLFANYARRQIFTMDSARQIRRFGMSCILWGAIKVIWAFMPMALSARPPSSFNLTADSVIIGAVIVGISWFAEMATALREENDLTI